MISNAWRQIEIDFGDAALLSDVPDRLDICTSEGFETGLENPQLDSLEKNVLDVPPDAFETVVPGEKGFGNELNSLKNQRRKTAKYDHLHAHSRRIAGHLTVHLPEPVDVVFTDNRSTMVSFQRRGGRLLVRLHLMFRHSDETILDSLALYLGKRDPEASGVLDRFFREHQDEIRKYTTTRAGKLRSKGKHWDLKEVFERINQTYFDGQINAKIGWGRAPAKRRSRRRHTMSRALATYRYDEQTIRVSPVLDDPDVPSYVLDWIVYHEMLHHVLPVEKHGDRRLYHTERFNLLERAFTHYEEARAWEKKHLDKLLS